LALEACGLSLGAWGFSELLFGYKLIINGYLDANPAPVVGHESELSIQR